MSLQKIKDFLQAAVGGFLPVELGRGPGFIGLAVLEVLVASALIHLGKDVSYLGAIFGAINVPVYGAGAWKVSSDNKAAANGHANGKPSSSASSPGA